MNIVSRFEGNFFDDVLEDCRKKFSSEVENIIKACTSELGNQISAKLKAFSETANDPVKTRSYASVASKSAFALKPKNSDQSVKATKADVLQNIDPVESEISISHVVPMKNGGIVVQCNESESSKFKQLANSKLGAKYEVKQLSTLHPRVKIVGLSEKLEENVILRYLKCQNKSVFCDDSVCSIVSINNLKKNRNIYQILLQVDRVTYKKILEIGKIFIGYDYCSVYDGIELRRCYNCCNFNHLSKNCSKDVPSCARCSGSHSVRDCKSDIMCCILCSNFNAAHNQDINTNHAVWDSGCPVYQEALKRFKHNVLCMQ